MQRVDINKCTNSWPRNTSYWCIEARSAIKGLQSLLPERYSVDMVKVCKPTVSSPAGQGLFPRPFYTAKSQGDNILLTSLSFPVERH